ncbi:uncharacterized protein LOC126335625 [Schistocerca gregaria]|uniref:uncharacterized protein LOC126335625 n=1 Tax=Schistocerca gregaria TaxID=7010 RepID=UPI00211DB8A9|nr:uncharacterized protein LOC126335625 [Schistocerca gregaria]
MLQQRRYNKGPAIESSTNSGGHHSGPRRVLLQGEGAPQLPGDRIQQTGGPRGVGRARTPWPLLWGLARAPHLSPAQPAPPLHPAAAWRRPLRRHSLHPAVDACRHSARSQCTRTARHRCLTGWLRRRIDCSRTSTVVAGAACVETARPSRGLELQATLAGRRGFPQRTRSPCTRAVSEYLSSWPTVSDRAASAPSRSEAVDGSSAATAEDGPSELRRRRAILRAMRQICFLSRAEAVTDGSLRSCSCRGFASLSCYGPGKARPSCDRDVFTSVPCRSGDSRFSRPAI